MDSFTGRELTEADGGRLKELLTGILGSEALAKAARRSFESGRTRLVGADDGQGLACVAPFTMSPDGSAQFGGSLFHARAAGREAEALKAEAEAVERLGTRLIHAAAAPESDVAAWLCAAGFAEGPVLREMRRTTPQEAAGAKGKWVEYEKRRRGRFAEVFYRTLEGSLDVAEVPVCRDGELLMKSFEARGEMREGDFAILTERGCDAGLLLVTGSGGQLEVVYLGVVKELRGMGLGDRLLERALERGQRHGAGVVKAFVDTRNAPAVRLYERNGFSESRAVQVFIREAKKI